MNRGARRTTVELERAADEVASEWVTAAQLVNVASQFGTVRSVEQTAVITAIVVHYRCLVNFVSGGYNGSRMSMDIAPADFLGRPWHPADEKLDRTMRGRLQVLNTEQQHLSWRRLEERPTMWAGGLLVLEVSTALLEFAEALKADQAPGAQQFESAGESVRRLLPSRQAGFETAVELAPPRLVS